MTFEGGRGVQDPFRPGRDPARARRAPPSARTDGRRSGEEGERVASPPHFRAGAPAGRDPLLKPGGKVYLDASATRRKHGQTSFLETYVFPGNGSLLCLHEYLAEVARSPFRLEGVWDDRHSYYLTTKAWAENLDRARGEVEARWGKALHRTFQLYLWGAADGLLKDRNQAYRVVLGTPS